MSAVCERSGWRRRTRRVSPERYAPGRVRTLVLSDSQKAFAVFSARLLGVTQDKRQPFRRVPLWELLLVRLRHPLLSHTALTPVFSELQEMFLGDDTDDNS